jgi:D-arabinan exo alpha-(1,3)/(1,5)-arabinofuranosidase (non-reducing end)
MSRRRFVAQTLAGGLGLAALSRTPLSATVEAPVLGSEDGLPAYARAQRYRSLKQSSHDVTGGNRDYWPIQAGAEQELFSATGAGMISHIWFTIAAQSALHLKELVLRGFWDGASKPSIETPIGDFFGLNTADYVIYESEYLACSPGQSLNCYFAMPYRAGARLTVTNEGSRDVGAFYSNIDYLELDELPADALYFHAQYRQAAPNPAQQLPDGKNPDGATNYVYCESRGRGHLMGVTLGVVQNSEYWMGEGDDMIFVDDAAAPAIIGTGSEDYFLGSWDFGGRMHAQPFAHRQYGAPLIQSAERMGGRYCCYRFHGDNPVTFTRYLKHTMEHGHANNRADCFYSCCYWYQDRPYTDFPALPPVADRMPAVKG